ncbi:tetratricopeptide repeat protein [Dendronalium sp. ChiSLP03b]|uniref:CHAT domain-containing protein n=1 Tax=Dendronalium sp. ChiSLP03b TaxID=3075381 RepID=UPI00391BE23D
MLKQLWQWLKRSFGRLFGRKHTPLREQRKVEPPKPLTDTEYESLFLQLLAEVNDGLTRGGVKGFLAARRINETNLVEWLRGFGERLLASATPNDELATRMVQLGELSIGEVSDVAYDVGRRLLERGETNRQGVEEAEEEETSNSNQFNDAGELTNSEAEAWFNQGVALANLGLHEQAIAFFDDAIEIKPDFYDAWRNRGVALLQLGRYEEANAAFNQALKSQIKPDDHLAWYNRGLSLYVLGQYEQAIASFDNALKIKPNSHEAWTNRGVALGDLGEFEEAIASFDKALKFKPDFHEAWYIRGGALANLGELEQAIASYDNALKFKPDFHEAWNNRGGALADLGRFEEAIASFDNALKIKPDKDQAWNNRGTVLHNLGELEQAIASYDNALKIKPDDYLAWYNRGTVLADLGELQQAIASYDNALKIKPDDYEAWNNRGLALADLRELEQAIASYDNALKIKPDDYEAWNNRGVALHNLGELEQAIASYDNALKIKPDKDQAWNNRGTALADLGELEQALASYDSALKIKPDFHEAWINRGIAAGNVTGQRTDFSFTFTLPNAAAPNLALKFNNPDLNKRGYEGLLASYEEGLKHCQQDTHPEGWGKLHQAIGNAHYFRGRGNSNARYYWRKAVNSYNEVLQTLTAVDFPELHLEVLQDLIRVQLDLGETAEATELQRQGTDLLRRLSNEPNRSERSKKQLALKFAWIQQLTVDLAVHSGDLLQAIELAEEGKNTCLRWLLDGWNDQISSSSYAEIQQLLNPSTAIIYWHLSSYALHTFILKHNAPSPIVLGKTEFLTQAQRLRDFEGWVKNWNEQYTDYRKGKDKQGEKDRTWRNNLPEMLHNLSTILDINAVVSAIPDITQLILIPHRDLHRFPLHALFPPEFTITYLPSAKIVSIPVNKGSHKPQNLLSIEHPNSTGYPSLEFAQVESEAISRMFPNPTRKHSEQATKAALITALPQNYSVFHFTGHGAYNFQNPALSHLALAGEEKLTLADIHGFNLQSYQLVTLAACETAITGNYIITTEYVGLVSGFMGCGVAHVVSTLWTVESAASALVMIQFYQLLQQGKPETVALTEATQWLRNVTNAELAEWYAAQIAKLSENEGLVRRFLSRYLDNIKNTAEPNNKPYNHPYFWAAYTITGNPS